MAVRHEIKSQLAKLLATEDLIVEHKKVETAQFNVHTRVLILPQWDLASNNVYDMLVGHEVGHALFTPDVDWFIDNPMPPQFVNIVEDARIEKLMKRKYPGLAKTFYTGYNELHDKDFFETYGEDLSTFNIADRTNLYFKVGSFLPVVFSSAEKQIISLIEKCETFDDTIDAAKKLYELCKVEVEKNNKEKEENGIQGDQIPNYENRPDLGEDNVEYEDDTEEEEYQAPSPQGSQEEGDVDSDKPTTSNFNPSGGFDNDLDAKTVEKLENAIKHLANASERNESTYFELPNVNVDQLIVSNSTIHDRCKESYEEQEKLYPHAWDAYEDDGFIEFKRSAQKEVNYLVKEFECKKAADSYARASTARTGVLDCTKLHTYRYNEDLFKKVTTLADGKNHGLVFVLDWSGSMAEVMLDTIKQLYNLMWFCKKVNIPFEVYAFTNDCAHENMGKPSYEKKSGIALLEETFSLMNLFTSKVKTKVMEEQMRNIFRIALSFSRQSFFHVPLGMRLSGTPLNETLVCLHKILPRFKEENKIQKVQCVILTDGESQPLRYSKEFLRKSYCDLLGEDEVIPYMGSGYVSQDCVLRDRKTGRTYTFENAGYWADITDTLIENLRHNFPDMNFIGIRVLQSRDAGQFIRRYTGYEDDGYNKIMSRWKKERSFAILNSGYDTYFGISANVLSNDDDFEVKEDATKAQIRTAFKKSLKSKKMNKKVLGEFIELVA